LKTIAKLSKLAVMLSIGLSSIKFLIMKINKDLLRLIIALIIAGIIIGQLQDQYSL
jgi:hypothetical protein